jgi:multiple sugar transport system substrate-binding protein
MYKNKVFSKKILKKLMCLSLVVFTSIGTAACGSSTKNRNAAKTSGNNALSISVITKDAYLDTAIQKFKKLHPEVTIDVKEYTSDPMPTANGKTMVRVGEKPEDLEKYVTAMNTQLMSGEGTDIMLLNPLPYEKYIDKNLLANISDMMKADKNFDINKYYTNILDAVKHNGTLYGIPLGISINVLEANRALLDKYNIKIDDSTWTWNDFEKTAEHILESSKKEGVQGMYALSGMDGNTLISSLVTENYNDFIDRYKKSANFNSKEFIDLLNLAKSMIDKNYVNTDTSQGKMTDLAMRGNTVFSPATLGMYMNLMLTKEIYSNGAEYLKFPSDRGTLSFTTTALYGINNKSANKDLAWEFLKFLISDEMMSEPSLTGLPIHKAASKKAAQNAIDMSKKVSNKGGNGNNKIMMNMNGQSIDFSKPLTEEDVKTVQNLIGKANKYTAADQKVLNILKEETKAFFDGQKSAADTAKAIQDRVNTYINE